MRRNAMVPIIMIFALMVLSNLMRGGFSDPVSWLIDKLMILPGIVIALSFHEFGHAIVSTKLGDPTPERQGRVTLNPMAHIDPVGMACLIFAGFGWGVPVQIDPTYYRNRRSGEIMVGFAGVAMNLILAIAFTVLLKVLMVVLGPLATDDIWSVAVTVIENTIYINIILMVFNLIPIPPLDGFGIVTQIFRLERYSWYSTLYNYGYFILIFAVLMGWVGTIISPVAGLFLRLLYMFLAM